MKKAILALLFCLWVSAPALAQGPRTFSVDSSVSNAAATIGLQSSANSVGITVTGLTAASAILTPEASNDSITAQTPTWTAIAALDFTGGTHTTLTADGQFQIPAGHAAVRLRVSTTGTGIVTVTSFPSGAEPPGTAGAVSGTVTANQGGAPWSVTNPATGGTGLYASKDATTTDATLSLGGHTNFLDIVNANETGVLVCVNFGSTATINATPQCTGGAIPIPPNWHRSWPDFSGGPIPQDAVHVIASATCTGCLTVGVK